MVQQRRDGHRGEDRPGDHDLRAQHLQVLRLLQAHERRPRADRKTEAAGRAAQIATPAAGCMWVRSGSVTTLGTNTWTAVLRNPSSTASLPDRSWRPGAWSIARHARRNFLFEQQRTR